MIKFYTKKYIKHDKSINELIGELYDARMKTWLIKNHKRVWKNEFFEEDLEYFDLEKITKIASYQYAEDQSRETEIAEIDTDPMDTWKERKQDVVMSNDFIEWIE